TGTVLLLAQPYLTLRLVRKLRPVPAWAMWGALVAFVGTSAPLLAFGARARLPVVLAAVLGFVVVEAAAAVLLFQAARRRTGSPRTRLMLAALATASFAGALLAAGAG